MPTLAIAALVLAVAILRLTLAGTAYVNYVPVAAIALCAGLFVPRFRAAMLVALGGLLVSDVALSLQTAAASAESDFWRLTLHPELWLRYLFYGLILAFAWLARRHRSAGLALWATPLGTLFFYVASNTVSWAASAPPFAYPKTIAGWWQSQTIGLPQFEPASYVFLRNAFIGDLLFTLAFLTIAVWLPAWRKKRPAPVTVSSGIPS